MRRIIKTKPRLIGEPTQREVLRGVMLSATECGTWLTLDELAKLTHYPQTSISAQLRHLRKPSHGGFLVEKQRRKVEEMASHVARRAVWEYRL